MHPGARGVETHRAGPVESDRPDVSRSQTIDANRLLGHLHELPDLVVERDAESLGGASETIHVIGEAEYRWTVRGLVCTDALERTRAVVEAVDQDVDRGIFPTDELAVHPDVFGGVHGMQFGM